MVSYLYFISIKTIYNKIYDNIKYIFIFTISTLIFLYNTLNILNVILLVINRRTFFINNNNAVKHASLYF